MPALEIEGSVIFESLAICLYLADHYPKALLAPQVDSPERSEYYQWMAFSTGTLEPSIIEEVRHKRAQESNIDIVDMGPTLTKFTDVMAYINHKLLNTEFLISKNFNAADLMISSMLMWAENQNLLAGYDNIKHWIEHIKQRPAYSCSIIKCHASSG